MRLYTDRYNVFNNSDLFTKVYCLLSSRRLSFYEIKTILINEGYKFSDEELNSILIYLVSSYRNCLRYDFFDKLSEYEVINMRDYNLDYQTGFYSFNETSLSDKSFMLISDTHIGNEKYFDKKLISNLYDYAVLNGIRNIFHLGDVFDGNPVLLKYLEKRNQIIKSGIYRYSGDVNLIDSFKKEFDEQIEIFDREYPKCDEVFTYAISGNHDSLMNLFLQTRNRSVSCDLRILSLINNSFYMLPRGDFDTIFNNVPINFNHKLRLSSVMRDVKINDVFDIVELNNKYLMSKDYYYDFLICGHMHKGFISVCEDKSMSKDKIYLGVPSTSKININSCVGYIINLNEDKNLEIIVLGCDENYHIYEMERLNFTFGKKSKVLSKLF